MLIRGSCSSNVLIARESLSSPRLVATTPSSVPDLKSVADVCVQKLVLTAMTGAAINITAMHAIRFMFTPGGNCGRIAIFFGD